MLDYEWQLVHHLLPFFKDHLLSQITVAEVDRYRESKVSENRAIEAAAKRGKPRMLTYTDKIGKTYKRPERPLSATSINKTITRLGQVLELALERGLIESNAAKIGGKRRKFKASRPARIYLDRAEQIEALLEAAGRIDAGSRPDHRIARRAMLATLTFAGLRISELLDLEWRDVDLAGGRLRVRKSKTDAGVRYVKLEPVLRDELAAHKANGGATEPRQLVFPSAVGTRQDRNRVRGRVLAGAVKGANEQLADEGLAALPDGLTLHALRRTFCSVLIALGYDLAYVKEQAGHEDAAVTLGIYAQVMRLSEGDRGRLRLLVKGGRESDYLAVAGSGTDLATGKIKAESEGITAEVA